MKFSKTKKLLKKDEKNLESNPINDVFHAAMPERKDRSPQEAEEEEDDLEDLKEKKRKRYELIKKKYSNVE